MDFRQNFTQKMIDVKNNDTLSEWHSAEWRSAECLSTECRGTPQKVPTLRSHVFIAKRESYFEVGVRELKRVPRLFAEKHLAD